ncbi:MAG: glycoside hydrolase family 130 protein [Sedimentisphaerales bacterium]|nr:glycoside hydrolase family 130 protein [Sedimentisphaerales bacterium]
MKAYRCPHNPLITTADIAPSEQDFEIIGVFNAGVVRVGDEVVLLVRVAERPVSRHPDVALASVYSVTQGRIVLKEFSKNDPSNDFSDSRLIVTPAGTYLTSISHLRLARSTDGVNFDIDDSPAFAAGADYETFGIEDPRISFIDGRYHVSYVAASPLGITTALASTKDFCKFERHGVIFCPDNKDVAIFSERIKGRYYALHRPNSGLFRRQDIWIADSPDLRCWGNHRCLIGTRQDSWDKVKIGAGATPFKTPEGWVEVYHGVDEDNRYCLGAVLLDSVEPWKVLGRSGEPIFEPETDYECEGFFGNVVFSCGVLCEDEKVKIYYGAADTSICYAEVGLGDVLRSIKPI